MSYLISAITSFIPPLKYYLPTFDDDDIYRDTPEGYYPQTIKIDCMKMEFYVNISYEEDMWIIKRVYKTSDAYNKLFNGDIIYKIGRIHAYNFEDHQRLNQVFKNELSRNNYKFIEFTIFRKFRCRQILNHQGCEDWTIVEKNV